MKEKELTFNVKYEIVLYTPVFNAWKKMACIAFRADSAF